MASAAAVAAARSGRAAASRISLLSSASANAGTRGVRPSGAKQMGSKAEPSYDDYIHAEHMYNIPAMKHRKLKIGLGVFGSLAFGTFVPIFAVMYQQKKTGAA